MPRKAEIHTAERNALIRDGWTITHDPFRIVYADTDIYADLRIVKTVVRLYCSREKPAAACREHG